MGNEPSQDAKVNFAKANGWKFTPDDKHVTSVPKGSWIGDASQLIMDAAPSAIGKVASIVPGGKETINAGSKVAGMFPAGGALCTKCGGRLRSAFKKKRKPIRVKSVKRVYL